MINKKQHLAIEILPRALWVVMALCLYLGQYFTDPPPKLNNNILLIFLGSLLIITGFLLWMYVGYYMRKALFDKSLIITGPFKYVRHPMYVSIYIMLVGSGILFFSKIWFIIMLIFIPIFYLDCNIEEKQMTELHGKKYLDYKKETGMFLLKLFKE